MNIYLKSRVDILGWSSLFRILGYDLCIPIWDILEIPPSILDKPERILEVSRTFFKRGGEITVEKTLSSDEVLNHLEARRMIDLGYLYNYFGRVVASYGEQTATQLFRFGEIHFVGEISRYWDIWHSMFSKLLRTDLSQNNLLDEELYKTVLGVIKSNLEQEKIKQEKLKYLFDQMCQEYYLNLEEERKKLGQLLLHNAEGKEYPKNGNFNDAYEDLERIFSFDLLLLQVTSYEIWRDFLSTFKEDEREKVFQFAIQQLSLIDKTFSEKIKKLKINYLNMNQ